MWFIKKVLPLDIFSIYKGTNFAVILYYVNTQKPNVTRILYFFFIKVLDRDVAQINSIRLHILVKS